LTLFSSAQIKADPELRKIPVIMVTTTDDPREVERCHALGCSSYITKPVEYDTFVNAIYYPQVWGVP